MGRLGRLGLASGRTLIGKGDLGRDGWCPSHWEAERGRLHVVWRGIEGVQPDIWGCTGLLRGSKPWKPRHSDHTQVPSSSSSQSATRDSGLNKPSMHSWALGCGGREGGSVLQQKWVGKEDSESQLSWRGSWQEISSRILCGRLPVGRPFSWRDRVSVLKVPAELGEVHLLTTCTCFRPHPQQCGHLRASPAGDLTV